MKHQNYYYEGEWKANKREGKGVYKYHDGDVYDNEWVQDKREGKGKMTFMRDYSNKEVDVYEGDWKKDVKQRNRKLKFHLDKVYEGEFNEDEMSGWGIMKYTDSIYDEEWISGKLRGHVYEGGWIDDKKEE